MSKDETVQSPPPTDELQLEYLRVAKETIKDAAEIATRIELDLMQRAAERGATTIFGNGMKYVTHQLESLCHVT